MGSHHIPFTKQNSKLFDRTSRLRWLVFGLLSHMNMPFMVTITGKYSVSRSPIGLFAFAGAHQGTVALWDGAHGRFADDQFERQLWQLRILASQHRQDAFRRR